MKCLLRKWGCCKTVSPSQIIVQWKDRKSSILPQSNCVSACRMKLEQLSVCLKYINTDLVLRQSTDLFQAHAGTTEEFGSNSMTFQQYMKDFPVLPVEEIWWRASVVVKGLLDIWYI